MKKCYKNMVKTKDRLPNIRIKFFNQVIYFIFIYLMEILNCSWAYLEKTQDFVDKNTNHCASAFKTQMPSEITSPLQIKKILYKNPKFY